METIKLSLQTDFDVRDYAARARGHDDNAVCQRYGLTEAHLAGARPDAIVMHPGPINRGVELDSGTADGPRSVILQQVTHGIAIRMAVISMVMAGHTGETPA